MSGHHQGQPPLRRREGQLRGDVPLRGFLLIGSGPRAPAAPEAQTQSTFGAGSAVALPAVVKAGLTVRLGRGYALASVNRDSRLTDAPSLSILLSRAHRSCGSPCRRSSVGRAVVS